MNESTTKEVLFVGIDNIERIWDGEKFIDAVNNETDNIEIYINDEHKATVGVKQEVTLKLKEGDVLIFMNVVTKLQVIVTPSFPKKIQFKINEKRKGCFDVYSEEGQKLRLKNSLAKRNFVAFSADLARKMIIRKIVGTVLAFIIFGIISFIIALANS